MERLAETGKSRTTGLSPWGKWPVLFWASLLLAGLTTGSLVVAVISGISLLSI